MCSYEDAIVSVTKITHLSTASKLKGGQEKDQEIGWVMCVHSGYVFIGLH